MATYGYSTWQGRVRRPASYPTADAPIDTVLGRDHSINNVNHYSDIFGQVRAAWVSQASSYIKAQSGYTGQWHQMWNAGAFPIALLPDGSSYRLRLRLSGCATSGAAPVKFAVTLCSTAPGGRGPSGRVTDSIWQTGSITSTSPAWLTANSSGPNAWSNMISLTATEAASCVRRTATVLDTNGVGVEVTQAMVQAIVWTYVDDNAFLSRLYGLSLEEWPG